MDYEILSKRRNNNVIIEFLKNETLLVVAGMLAIITSFISTPDIKCIDFKVLALLFNLMIVVAGLKKAKFLDNVAVQILKKCTDCRSIFFTFVLLTFIFSMFVTNDVALITFVPLTLIAGKKAKVNTLKIIVFETLAANLGSTLTPMGNPQNLYLYSHFNISPIEFFKITFPVSLISLCFLIVFIIKENKNKLNVNLKEIKITNKNSVYIFLGLFFIILLSVFHIIDYKIAFAITLITVLLNDRKLFMDVDYTLILTFIAFFIFIGNVSSWNIIKDFMESILNSGKNTFLSGVFCSQVISNVPATMLISPFTDFYKELLLGVDVGGLGTLIASLASVISYKLFVKEYPEESKKYLKSFIIYNVLGLAVLVPFVYFVLI